MTELRALCGTLLNGCPDAGDLAAAEAFLRSALAEGARDEGSRQNFPLPWEPAGIPPALLQKVPSRCPPLQKEGRGDFLQRGEEFGSEPRLRELQSPPENSEVRRTILGGLAPTLLLDGIWLARVAPPATAHRPGESLLFDLYCRTVGLDDPARSPPLRFRAALTTAGVHLPPLEDPGFFPHAAIPDGALKLPCLHLSLMHRPRAFFPELLGYTLAHVHRERAWWDAVPAEGRPFETEARPLALAALAAYPERNLHGDRILAGWALYRFAFDTLLGSLAELLSRRATAEDAMAAIVRAKRAYALGYHGRIRLEGRSLDQWLAEAGTDCRPLLRALGKSPEVNQACPAGSRLVRAMDFGGPMFGVFDEAERRLCLEWIEAPQRQGFPPFAGNPLYPLIAKGPRQIPPIAKGEQGGFLPRHPASASRSKREIFTALLRAESPADCPPAAEAFIGKILRRSRRLLPLQARHRRGFVYSPEVFHRYLDECHRREVGRYRPLAGPPPVGREFCRWAVLQLAPAILVDGAWLAGIAAASESLGETGRHLLKIYADELGNGRPEWNHPNVYRRLLESLDLDLPPVDSEAFARNPGFLDAAFDIPVYLLAMGLSASRHFPELLGLNLAIELSGLGAGYLGTIDLLRHHGLDPTIIRLHLSIDNLASGHAARAREAIVLTLDEVRRREGAAAVEAQWKRIWMGYLSLNTAALGLAASFSLRFLGDRLRGAIQGLVPGRR